MLKGLTTQEAADRLIRFGPNSLPAERPTSLWAQFLKQFSSPLIYLLLAALVIELVIWLKAGASGLPVEVIAISAILLLNAMLGTAQEHRAERAIREISQLASPQVVVLRDGELSRLPASQVVPGDVVRLEAGDRIVADAEILSDVVIGLDESIITGESLPVEKREGDTLLSGTVAVRGSGFARVTATGSSSALGTLATSVQALQIGQTPLERKLAELGVRLTWWLGAGAALILVLGLAIEGIGQIERIFVFSIALAVAAVPEGLPTVLTLALALGIQRMSRRNVVVRRMSAVEALGSVTVIATDKTGTLTENQITLESVVSEQLDFFWLAGVLANDATSNLAFGDPVDLAFLKGAIQHGLDVDSLRSENPILNRRPFDSAWGYSSVEVEYRGERVLLAKGSPEAISKLCGTDQPDLLQAAAAGAAEGSKVLACSAGPAGESKIVGLAFFGDPPRPGARAAVEAARTAGVRVVMVTGDHPATAGAVAAKVGIPNQEIVFGWQFEEQGAPERRKLARENSIFARFSPEQKLQLVQALQEDGEVVAVTGDGVNDAPALKRSDVGVAMGLRGSSVAREVSDIVLLDDNFATIVAAIEEGRVIYDNVQKFVRFLFSTNMALVVLVLGGALGSAALGLRTAEGHLLLPMTALQLLWINFLGDGLPALALAVDRSQGVLLRPPRRVNEPLLDRTTTLFILASGILKGSFGLAILWALRNAGTATATIMTCVFLFDLISEVLYAYPVRFGSGAHSRNVAIHVAISVTILLQIAAVSNPTLRSILGLRVPRPQELLLVVIAILTSLGGGFLLARLLRQNRPATS